MMELDILRSATEFPKDFQEFLHGLPMNIFSKQAQIIAQEITKLGETSININSLESTLSSEFKDSEFYINFLNANIDPNYLNLKPIFIKEYQLKVQSTIAQKMLQSASIGEIVDIDVLKQNFQNPAPQYKTLTQWQDFFLSKPPLMKFKTHIPFLDTCFDGGIEVGQLVLISGDPEAGKTMLGTQILENIAKSYKVGFFCFEFTIQSYLKAKKNSRVNLNNIIALNDGYNINEIAMTIKEMAKTGVRVFLIDSQMRITSPAGRNMEEEESLKFSTLAKICHSLDVLIFLIVQTSKGDRDNPMGSKKGGHEASIIMRIEHTKAKDENLREFNESERMFIVKKNKQTGKHFKEKVFFNPQTLRFTSQQREVEEDAQRLNIEEIMSLIKGF